MKNVALRQDKFIYFIDTQKIDEHKSHILFKMLETIQKHNPVEEGMNLYVELNFIGFKYKSCQGCTATEQ